MRYHNLTKSEAMAIPAEDHLKWTISNKHVATIGACIMVEVEHEGGYPMVWHHGNMIRMTQLMAATSLGVEVEELDGHSWTHSCRNKACVNINHRRVGTN